MLIFPRSRSENGRLYIKSRCFTEMKFPVETTPPADKIASTINTLRPNNDPNQTPYCNIKGLSASEVMRIVNMITQVQVY